MPLNTLHESLGSSVWSFTTSDLNCYLIWNEMSQTGNFSANKMMLLSSLSVHLFLSLWGHAMPTCLSTYVTAWYDRGSVGKLSWAWIVHEAVRSHYKHHLRRSSDCTALISKGFVLFTKHRLDCAFRSANFSGNLYRLHLELKQLRALHFLLGTIFSRQIACFTFSPEDTMFDCDSTCQQD